MQGARQYEEVKNRLDDLKQRVDDKLKEAESAMDDIDQSVQSYKVCSFTKMLFVETLGQFGFELLSTCQ